MGLSRSASGNSTSCPLARATLTCPRSLRFVEGVLSLGFPSILSDSAVWRRPCPALEVSRPPQSKRPPGGPFRGQSRPGNSNGGLFVPPLAPSLDGVCRTVRPYTVGSKATHGTTGLWVAGMMVGGNAARSRPSVWRLVSLSAIAPVRLAMLPALRVSLPAFRGFPEPVKSDLDVAPSPVALPFSGCAICWLPCPATTGLLVSGCPFVRCVAVRVSHTRMGTNPGRIYCPYVHLLRDALPATTCCACQALHTTTCCAIHTPEKKLGHAPGFAPNRHPRHALSWVSPP